MLYFDTSFIVPLLLAEATSEDVQQFFNRSRDQDIAISQWTRVEFGSALAREVRMDRLSKEAASEVGEIFESVVAESFLVLTPDAEDYILACEYLRQYKTGLRGGDALHLAIGFNHRAEGIYSLDRRLLEAGELLGLPVKSGIRLP